MRFTWVFLLLLFSTGCKTKQKIPRRTDNTSSQVLSQPKNGNSDFRLLEQKFQKDVQFYGIGSEPFWSLDMNFTLFMHFKLMDSMEIHTAAGRPQTAPDGISTLFRAASENGELVVSVMPQKCTDKISGKTFSHQVAVRARVSPDAPYTEVSGCGQYVPDFRLHNVWMLQAIDGEELLTDSLAGELPRLEIFLEKSSVTGFAGCNSFSGTFTHEGNNIQFGEIACTEKTCPQIALEEKFLQALRGQSYYYAVSHKGTLKLMNARHSLVFRMGR